HREGPTDRGLSGTALAALQAGTCPLATAVVRHAGWLPARRGTVMGTAPSRRRTPPCPSWPVIVVLALTLVLTGAPLAAAAAPAHNPTLAAKARALEGRLHPPHPPLQRIT